MGLFFPGNGRTMSTIFDLDGTLCDCNHRLHYVTTKPKNYKAFFKGIPHDLPILGVQELVYSLQRAGQVILFVTARPEYTRAMTMGWLQKYVPTSAIDENLYMKADDDHRKDYEVKKDLLNAVRGDGHWPLVAVDDKPAVIKMFIENGLTGLWVGGGQYDFKDFA